MASIGEQAVHHRVHVPYGIKVCGCADCAEPVTYEAGDWPGLEDDRPWDEAFDAGYFDDVATPLARDWAGGVTP